MSGVIKISPAVFNDKRDALAVAFNEGLRLTMEDMKFTPAAEPTDEQRQFFSNTAYAEDDVALKRTILARIATHDTSVSPTPEQEAETVEFLGRVAEMIGQKHADYAAVTAMAESVKKGGARGAVAPGTEAEDVEVVEEPEAAQAADVGGDVKEFNNPLLREMIDTALAGKNKPDEIPSVIKNPEAKLPTKPAVMPRAMNYVKGAQPEMEAVVDPVIDALRIAEGNATAETVGDHGRAVGPLQTWGVTVDEANRIVGRKLWSYEDRKDLELSRAMAKTVLSFHYRRGTTDPVKLGAKWRNPYGAEAPKWYKDKVRKGLAETAAK